MMNKDIRLVKSDKIKPSKKKIRKVTETGIGKKVDELCEMMLAFDGDRADATSFACFKIALCGAHSRQEAYGILVESLLQHFNMNNLDDEEKYGDHEDET